MNEYQQTIIQVAKSYYNAGCNILPAWYGEKNPELALWKQFQDKRPSWEQLEAWLSDGRDHNLAMVCGKTSGGSIAVCFNNLDVYRRFYHKQEGDALRFTRVHSSRRGFHTFVKTDEEVEEARTRDNNIEIRGNGRIVIIPPSYHREGNLHYRSLNPDIEIAFIPDFWDWVEENSFRAGYLLVNKRFTTVPEDIQEILKGPIVHPDREPAMFKLACYLAEFWDKDKVRERVRIANQTVCKPPKEDKVIDKKVNNAFKEQYVQGREERRKQKADKEKTVPITFKELEDGSLAEVVYDSRAERGQLAIYRNDKISYVDRVIDRGKILVPRIDAYIEKNALKLPSGVEDYGTRDKLIGQIEGFIRKYIEYPEPHLYRFVAYYVLVSWLYDRFNAVFYLRHTGAIGSGKSTAGEVLSAISYKSIVMGGNITSAGLFRLMDSWRGTLVIDEAEFRLGSDVYDGILQVLNVGYKKRGGFVTRTEKSTKGNYTSIPYIAYGPKIIASRTGTEMATESRMFTITMRPRTKRVEDENLLDIQPEVFEQQALSLRNQLLKYRLDNYRDITPAVDKSIRNPRLREMLIPTYTLSRGDKRMGAILPKVAQCYQEEMSIIKSESLPGQIAEALVDIYNQKGSVSVGEVADSVNRRIGHDWVSKERVGRVIRKELRLKVKRRIREGLRERWVEVTGTDIRRLIR
jgi:hypothetical protein